MSIHSASAQTATGGVPDPIVRQAFVGNVHRLLALGYARLDPPTYQVQDENRITQDLVAALRTVTQDSHAPSWSCHFAIHEKQRQNDNTLHGNSRLELDITLERTQRGTHPTFVLEAKRLGPNHPVNTYLGPEGLGAFVSCEYAAEHTDAGMLGYVQSNTLATWSDSLADELGMSAGKHRVTANGTWSPHPFPNGPQQTYRTRHTRQHSQHGPITIYHTLLSFTS